MSKLRDKVALRESTTNTYREREPTSPEIAERGNVRMSIDYSRQNAVAPGSLGSTANGSPYRTTNADGRPFALDTMVGAGPDTRSRDLKGNAPLSPTKGK